MRHGTWSFVILSCIVAVRSVAAQPQESNPEPTPDTTQRAGRGETPRQLLDRDFDRRAPQVGQPLPDIELHRADGAKTSLGKLKGKYTVLVFGCLT